MEEKKQRGGARPGAGRPKGNRKQFLVWANEEEYAYVKQCLEDYRAAKQEQKE